MNSVAVSAKEHLQALGRSAFLELLSLGFSYPADEQLRALEEQLEDLASAGSPWPQKVRQATRAALSALRQSPAGELETAYNALFSGQAVCSPYESAYRAGEGGSPQTTADVAGFYRAFGLSARAAADRPDHVAAELEFLALLLRRRVYAEASGLEEAAAVAREAEASFVGEHFGLWFQEFLEQVRAHSRTPFYVCLATLAELGPALEDTGADSSGSG